MIELDESKPRRKKRCTCWKCGAEVDPVIYKDINTIPRCPRCGSPYPEKPAIEAKLTIYQDAYLKNRTQENLNRLFIPINELVFNIICSKLKGSAKKLEQEKIQDMVQWSLVKLLGYYKNKPYFKISDSFVSYISKVVLYPLYNNKSKTKEHSEVSLYSSVGIDDGGKEKMLIDQLSETDYSMVVEAEQQAILKDQSRVIINETTYFIEATLNSIYKHDIEKQKENRAFADTIEMAMLYRHYVYAKNDRFFSELWKTCSIDLRENFNNTLSVLKDNLYKSAEN